MKAVQVLETNILHASDVLWWLDGSSGETPATMLRIPVALALQLNTKPRDLQVVHSAGKTALLRRPTTDMISGVASAGDKQRPVEPVFNVAGSVSDDAGRYIPRTFSISAGNGVGHAIVLYPSPLGCKFGPAGGLQGCVRFNGSGKPACWALLTLTVTTALGATLTFRGQANGAGDFMLPLNRLPPLPEGISHYSAELRVAALVSATADTPLDPSTLVAMNPGSLSVDNTFSSPIGLNVVPGEIRTIRSSNRDHLAVQPS